MNNYPFFDEKQQGFIKISKSLMNLINFIVFLIKLYKLLDWNKKEIIPIIDRT